MLGATLSYTLGISCCNLVLECSKKDLSLSAHSMYVYNQPGADLNYFFESGNEDDEPRYGCSNPGKNLKH
eukprot:IDg22390t1